MFEKLLPRSNVARRRSGDSSHSISFWAGLLPCDARCRILYLLLAKIAVSESAKNADSKKNASRGRIRIVIIKERVSGHRDFAARFRDGFLDTILNFQFGLIHDRGKFGNKEESSSIQHPLFAE